MSPALNPGLDVDQGDFLHLLTPGMVLAGVHEAVGQLHFSHIELDADTPDAVLFALPIRPRHGIMASYADDCDWHWVPRRDARGVHG